MKNKRKRSGEMVCCEACETDIPSYDVVHYGSIEQGYRVLCSHCFNAEVANAMGLDGFENVRLHPVTLRDCAGETHEFQFRMRLLGGSMVAIETFELTDGNPGGYQFQILGEPEDDPFSLLGRLIERMRRTLSIKHLVRNEHGTQIADMTVAGRIDCDSSSGDRVPLLVIDGQEVSWDRFGHMLMTFEGWQFRLAMVDRSEEV